MAPTVLPSFALKVVSRQAGGVFLALWASLVPEAGIESALSFENRILSSKFAQTQAILRKPALIRSRSYVVLSRVLLSVIEWAVGQIWDTNKLLCLPGGPD
jgi:hypothetical protein